VLQANREWVEETGQTHADGEIGLDALYILGKKSYVDVYYFNGRTYVNFAQMINELDAGFTVDSNGVWNIKLGSRIVAEPVNKPAFSAPLTNDGVTVHTPTYYTVFMINGEEYYKLRDIAGLKRSAADAFEITVNTENGMFSLYPGRPYTEVGNELHKRMYTGFAFAVPVIDTLYISGSQVSLSSYRIEGNVYFLPEELEYIFSVVESMRNLNR
jgi:hypothetical protein